MTSFNDVSNVCSTILAGKLLQVQKNHHDSSAHLPASMPNNHLLQKLGISSSLFSTHFRACDIYINAQMVIIMLNEKLLGLLMIIIEYLMILLILMKLIVVNSLHREYLEMNGVHMVVLPCTVI